MLQAWVAPSRCAALVLAAGELLCLPCRAPINDLAHLQVPAAREEPRLSKLSHSNAATVLSSSKKAAHSAGSSSPPVVEKPQLRGIPSGVAAEVQVVSAAGPQPGPIVLSDDEPAAVSIEEKPPERSYFQGLHAPMQQERSPIEQPQSVVLSASASAQSAPRASPPPSPFATADLSLEAHTMSRTIQNFIGDAQLQRIAGLVSYLANLAWSRQCDTMSNADLGIVQACKLLHVPKSGIMVLRGQDDVQCLAGDAELDQLSQRLLMAVLPMHDPDHPADSSLLVTSSPPPRYLPICDLAMLARAV